MSKTTSLLKHMTVETDQCRNELSSCMAVVTLGQNVKTYPTTQCKFLLILKMGLPAFIGASCMQFTELWQIFWLSGILTYSPIWNANIIVGLLMALKTMTKTKWPFRPFG